MLTLIVLSCDADTPARRLYSRSTFIVCYVLLGVVFCRLIAQTDGAVVSVTLERFAVLLPLSAVVGWDLAVTGELQQYLGWLLVVGAVTVLPAVFERLSGQDLFQARSAFARNGANRAVVGTEHPLVLGAMFLSLMPVALWLVRRWYRYAVCLALYAGVWTTGGNGAEIVGGLLLVVLFVPAIARGLLSQWYWLAGGLAGLGAFIGVGGVFLWSSQVFGSSSVAVSNGYREALYNLLTKLLVVRPAGYGLSGLPRDTWYVGTQVSGITDISKSVDSELVLSVANFGWFALVGYVVIVAIGVAATMYNHAVGLSSLAVSLVGLFLAIHSWTSLGCYWFVGIGASSAIIWRHGGLPVAQWRLGTPGSGSDPAHAARRIRARASRTRISW